jgi:hypothetical protein
MGQRYVSLAGLTRPERHRHQPAERPITDLEPAAVTIVALGWNSPGLLVGSARPCDHARLGAACDITITDRLVD